MSVSRAAADYPRRARAHSFKEAPFHGAKAIFASPTAHTVPIASLVFRATMRIQSPLLRRSSGRAAPNRNFFAGILAILVSSGCGGVTAGTSEDGSGKPPEEGVPSRRTGCTGVHSGTLTHQNARGPGRSRRCKGGRGRSDHPG
jgi:hypothetical protein